MSKKTLLAPIMSEPGHFLDEPEIKKLLSDVFTTLVAESDRGAVLIGFSHVDNHLRLLFDRLAPARISATKRKHVFEYPGALSTAASKMEIAFFTRLLPQGLYDAMQHLRILRNRVAHSPESFTLSDHDATLAKIYSIGPNVPHAVNRFAVEILADDFAGRLINSSELKDPNGKPYFETPAEVFNYISIKPKVLAMLEEKRRRCELGIGIALICAVIVYHRERLRELFHGHETLFELWKERAAHAGESRES